MNAALLQLFGGLNPFPGGRHLDQYPVNVNAFGLVQRNQAFAARHGGGGVKAQARIDLGRDPARNQRQDLAAKAHQQPVHDLVQRPVLEAPHGVQQQRCVIGFLHRLQNQRRIGRGVLRLELGQLFEVTGIGYHGGVQFQDIELVHGKSARQRRGSWFK